MIPCPEIYAKMGVMPHLTFEQEIMSEGFMKYHIKGLPFDAALHHFTKVDEGDLHDHPFAFTTHILKGGYIEVEYTVMSPFQFYAETKKREAGTSHRVEATTIHKMTSLPEGECWTLILPEPKIRDSRFWNALTML